jgi:hypothetical protein
MNLTTHESSNRRALNYLWSNGRRQFYNPFDRGSTAENWQEFLLVRDLCLPIGMVWFWRVGLHLLEAH